MISNLLKEVYEKSKVKKLAASGKGNFNGPGDGVHTQNTGKVPPFVKGRKPPAQNDAMAKAKQNAVQSRLAKMKAANSKGK